jgi:hypothetical protein
MIEKVVQEQLDTLERVGLVRKTGTFRLDEAGVPQPLYECVPVDEQDEAAKAYARLLQQGANTGFA